MPADASFLTYYLSELDQLRVAGSQFAKANAHLAGALDFQGSQTADPQIARLIESFAFLTARLHQRFDADFPQIPTALLETLYPQLVAPIPSMAIADFPVSPKQDRAIEGVVVPRETTIFARTASGAECRFRTGFALPLWPVAVESVTMPAPAELNCLDTETGVQACVRVRISCIGPTRTFAELAPPALQLYVEGDRTARVRLFELLCNNLIKIGVIVPGETDETVAFPRGLSVRQMGLEPDQAMLPYPEASHHGYRLLQEYFNFPDKFMFLELTGIAPGTLGTERHVDLLFLLDSEPATPLAVDARSLRIGCVPIVNLFQQTSEPIRLDHLSVDYPLEPDIRAAATTEVHTVLAVTRSAAGKERADVIAPYFSPNPDIDGDQRLRWLARRRPSANPALGGTDVQLSFVDPAMRPEVPQHDVLFAHLLCTNRALPRQVSSATRFEIEFDLPIRGITCLARPTPPIDPPMAGENLWRLVSHLSLNLRSLGSGEDKLEALKQILFLYAGADETSRKRRQIEGIVGLKTRPSVRRLGRQHWRGFVRGVEISVTLRESQFAGGSAYLFGSVLDRFFALYAGVNSFTETVIFREHHDEEWTRWPARAGANPVL